MSDEPAGAIGHNLIFLSYSDKGGRGDGVQMVMNGVDIYKAASVTSGLYNPPDCRRG